MTQTQTQDSQTQLFFETWGSYGQYHVKLAILKDGTVIDPSNISIPRGTKSIVKINKYEFIAVNDSSRKNTKVYINVPNDLIHAVIYIKKTTQNYEEFIHGSGSIITQEDTVEEKDDRYKYIKKILRKYYIDENIKALIKETETYVGKELIAKPRIKIRIEPILKKEIEIYGDTYNVKEELKKLGAKWNSVAKLWVIETENPIEMIEKLKTELEKIADVVVEQ